MTYTLPIKYSATPEGMAAHAEGCSMLGDHKQAAWFYERAMRASVGNSRKEVYKERVLEELTLSKYAD